MQFHVETHTELLPAGFGPNMSKRQNMEPLEFFPGLKRVRTCEEGFTPVRACMCHHVPTQKFHPSF